MSGMGWEMGGKFKGEGTYVHLWLIHVDVKQKPTQHCKAIVLQSKIHNFFLREMVGGRRGDKDRGKEA